jgi:predicted GNAT family N-acyltransferase
MAVLKEYRNKGVGSLILLKFLDLIKNRGFNRVYFSAQKTAENFYKKYGFVSCGDIFEEVGLPHIMMEKIL